MTPQILASLRKQEPALMLFFYNDVCGVCKALWSKVKTLMKERFPLVKVMRVNADQNRELAGQLQMLTVPGILLFLDDQEFYRGNGLVSLNQLEELIARPYCLLFGKE